MTNFLADFIVSWSLNWILSNIYSANTHSHIHTHTHTQNTHLCVYIYIYKYTHWMSPISNMLPSTWKETGESSSDLFLATLFSTTIVKISRQKAFLRFPTRNEISECTFKCIHCKGVGLACWIEFLFFWLTHWITFLMSNFFSKVKYTSVRKHVRLEIFS